MEALGEKKKRIYRKNTVQGKQRGKKYPETVKTAALCELLGSNNLSAVAQKYGVPESTLRGWLSKAKAAGPEGEKSLWEQAREEEIRRITLKAAQGARLTLEMMQRRLEAGERNLRRCDEIDALLLGEDKAEGIVTDAGGTVIGEVRGQKTLTRDFEEKLLRERQQRREVIPADFTLSNYARTLMAMSAKGAAESGAAADRPEAGLEQMLVGMSGEEF